MYPRFLLHYTPISTQAIYGTSFLGHAAVDESYSRQNVRARTIAEQSYYPRSVSADGDLGSVREHLTQCIGPTGKQVQVDDAFLQSVQARLTAIARIR